MCITVIGIPFAAATILKVGLCAIAFILLCLLAAAIACLLVYFFLKSIWCLLTRWPYWYSNFRIWRAERALLKGLPPPVTSEIDLPIERWIELLGLHRPLQPLPAAHIIASLREPDRVSDGERYAPDFDTAVPITELPGMIECQICMEEKLPSMFPVRPPTDECEHASENCCRVCLAQTIVTAFEGNVWDDIRCPMCNVQLQHKDIAEFAPLHIFEKYDALSTRHAVEKSIANFRWCLAPNCSSGQEAPDNPKDNPMMICLSCNAVQCSHHNIPWHTNMTCGEYDKSLSTQSNSAEKRSEKIIKRISKRCPKCNIFINKNGGCGHMTCSQCREEFCWNCLHVYPGHIWNCTRRF